MAPMLVHDRRIERTGICYSGQLSVGTPFLPTRRNLRSACAMGMAECPSAVKALSTEIVRVVGKL